MANVALDKAAPESLPVRSEHCHPCYRPLSVALTSVGVAMAVTASVTVAAAAFAALPPLSALPRSRLGLTLKLLLCLLN